MLPERPRCALLALLPALLLACGSDPSSTEGEPDVETSDASPEDLATAELIGRGDGSAASVRLTTVFEPSQHPDGMLRAPTAMAWNSARPAELWVTLREGPEPMPCNSDSRSACQWLWGYAAIITDADGDAPSVEVKRDDNAWHFMRRPTAIAFGDAELFATCAEARTSNFENEAAAFTGPVLWSSDPAIFGVPSEPDSPTGSTHLDMLHASPYCMGIAHERDNVYWVFNGNAGSLDRYDFHEPHEPGADDHSDGELWRYATGQVERVAETPSHMVYDRSTDLLYVADTGNQRIVRLHTKTGTPAGDVEEIYDPISTRLVMSGARLEEVVPLGKLGRPSGLALYQGVLFVTDPPNQRVVAFDLEGRLLRELDVGLPGGALGAVGVSPNGKVYITDIATGRVLRVDPL